MLCTQCCHGDGSGVRHVHIKYHSQSHYYLATVLVIAEAMCHDDGKGITAIRTIMLVIQWNPSIVVTIGE